MEAFTAHSWDGEDALVDGNEVTPGALKLWLAILDDADAEASKTTTRANRERLTQWLKAHAGDEDEDDMKYVPS